MGSGFKRHRGGQGGFNRGGRGHVNVPSQPSLHDNHSGNLSSEQGRPRPSRGKAPNNVYVMYGGMI